MTVRARSASIMAYPIMSQAMKPMKTRNAMKPMTISPISSRPSFGLRGGRGFRRRPQVRAKLRTGDAENGLITKRRFYANISKAMKMEPDRLVA